MEARFDNAIGGIPSRLIRLTLPWFALSCAIALTLGLILLNREHTDSKPHQLVTCAIFCISGSCMYLVYMAVNRMVKLAIASIESRSYRNIGVTGYDMDNEDWFGQDDSNTKLLDSEEIQKQKNYELHNRIHREDIISGMYMGGAGAFLSIPGLCMWDVPTTGAFLTALQLGGIWERIKVMEYKAGVDQVAAIGILRALHWGQHLLMFVSIQSAVWLSITRPEHPPVDWPLVAMTSFAPAMLRGSCRHWPPETTRGLSPPYALETGLPIATLLSILVVCWYTPVQPPPTQQWTTWIPMIVFCPPAIAITLAFILRGFRRRQTLGTGVVLVLAFCIFRCVCVPEDATARDRWLPLAMAIAMTSASVVRGWYHTEVVACDERPYLKREKTTETAQLVTHEKEPA